MRRLLPIAAILVLVGLLVLVATDGPDRATAPRDVEADGAARPVLEGRLSATSAPEDEADPASVLQIGPPDASDSERDGSRTPGVTVRGRVVDEAGGGVAGVVINGLRRIRVEMNGAPFDLFNGAGVATTDADGDFELEAVGVLTHVQAKGGPVWSPSELVAVDALAAVPLRVSSRVAVAGSVRTEDGDPAAGIEVLASWPGGSPARPRRSAAAVCDEEGRYEIRLPPGVMEIDVVCGKTGGQFRAGELMGEHRREVPVPARALDLTLRSQAFVRGRIVDVDGSPVTGLLRAVGLGDGSGPPATAAAIGQPDGTFVLGPVRPGTRWHLVLLPSAGRTYTERVVEAPDEGVVIVAESGGELDGRLVGKDVSGFSVQWTLPPGPEGVRTGTVKAASDGTFRIHGLPDVPVRLYARRIGDPRCGLVEHAVAGAPHDVRLDDGLAVEGTCGSHQGRVIARQGALRHEGRASNGRFEITGLPPGRWILRRVGRSGNIEYEEGPETPAEAGSSGVALR